METSLELYNTYEKFDAVITGRFHGLVMAILHKSPVMNISLPSHKQHKLITEHVRSLLPSSYSLEDIYNKDLFSEFAKFFKKSPRASIKKDERNSCIALANEYKSLISDALAESLEVAQ